MSTPALPGVLIILIITEGLPLVSDEVNLSDFLEHNNFTSLVKVHIGRRC